jgi:hypothetical protein
MVEAYSATRRPPAVHREITESSVDGRLKVTNTQVEDERAGRDDQRSDQGVARMITGVRGAAVIRSHALMSP